jgi:flagellar biosynthesis repressor protein FlbT
MSALILELKQGESMILNGAVIRFKTRARLELSTQARFLFGKQIMRAEDALTPVQKIYFALQQAYIGEEEIRPAALTEARALIEAERAAAAPMRRQIFMQMFAVISENAGFEALELARQLIREDAAAG